MEIKDLNNPETQEKLYQSAVLLMDAKLYSEAASVFGRIADYKDAAEKKAFCIEMEDSAHKDSIYAEADKAAANPNVKSQEKAIRIFKTIPGWRDADERVIEATRRIDEIIIKEREDREEAKRAAKLAEEKAKKRKKFLTRLALIGAACAVFAIAGVFLFKKFVVPQLNYRKAVTLMESGNQDEAYLMLHKLNVRNSSDLIAEITKDRLKDAEIGSTVLLGTYPQGPKAAKAKNQESTGIEWIVLDRDGSKLLLVSKYALNCLPYQAMKDSLVADTWQASLIRSWLNKTFAPEAFDDGESRFLVNINMDEEAGGKKAFLPGLDKVFLLSISEAEQYFPDDEARRCAPTRYAVDCGAYRSRAINTCFWWLRTTVEYTDTTLEGRPSETVTRAALVGSTGRIVDIGHYMYNMNYAVRPAVWVDLEAADGLEFNK